MNLHGKVIVISGGARGIGKSMAIGFKKQGAKVAIFSRTQSDVDQALHELNAIPGGDAMGFTADVLSESEQKSGFKKVSEQWGSVYGLVCAAGVYGSIGPFVETDFSQWKSGVEINLFGTALCVKTAFPYMKEAGEGRVILFSGGGAGALPNFSSYVTAKGGIWRMTETLGAELHPHGIFLNSIAPGAVNTKFLDDLIEAGPEKVGSTFYSRALKQKEDGGTDPDKAMELGVYLMSDQSNGLWGKTLSAVWDPYLEFLNLEKMSQSDIYTMRRVIDDQGKTRN